MRNLETLSNIEQLYQLTKKQGLCELLFNSSQKTKSQKLQLCQSHVSVRTNMLQVLKAGKTTVR
jgi:hypothetical protein